MKRLKIHKIVLTFLSMLMLTSCNLKVNSITTDVPQSVTSQVNTNTNNAEKENLINERKKYYEELRDLYIPPEFLLTDLEAQTYLERMLLVYNESAESKELLKKLYPTETELDFLHNYVKLLLDRNGYDVDLTKKLIPTTLNTVKISKDIYNPLRKSTQIISKDIQNKYIENKILNEEFYSRTDFVSPYYFNYDHTIIKIDYTDASYKGAYKKFKIFDAAFTGFLTKKDSSYFFIVNPHDMEGIPVLHNTIDEMTYDINGKKIIADTICISFHENVSPPNDQIIMHCCDTTTDSDTAADTASDSADFSGNGNWVEPYHLEPYVNDTSADPFRWSVLNDIDEKLKTIDFLYAKITGSFVVYYKFGVGYITESLYDNEVNERYGFNYDIIDIEILSENTDEIIVELTK